MSVPKNPSQSEERKSGQPGNTLELGGVTVDTNALSAEAEKRIKEKIQDELFGANNWVASLAKFLKTFGIGGPTTLGWLSELDNLASKIASALGIEAPEPTAKVFAQAPAATGTSTRDSEQPGNLPSPKTPPTITAGVSTQGRTVA